MKTTYTTILALLLATTLNAQDHQVKGLDKPVEIINAYIDDINSRPDELPLEFKLLKTKPQHWTPEVVISRHQGLLGNIGQELTIGRQVSKVGVEKTKEINYFHPGDPDNPFYDNLFDTWAKDKFFPLFYSKEKVLSVKAKTIRLVPK